MIYELQIIVTCVVLGKIIYYVKFFDTWSCDVFICVIFFSILPKVTMARHALLVLSKPISTLKSNIASILRSTTHSVHSSLYVHLAPDFTTGKLRIVTHAMFMLCTNF